MKVIIAGSRTMGQPGHAAELRRAISDSGYEITEVVCGCAAGMDALGEQWALGRGLPVTRFPANWKSYGKQAGLVRNQQMAEYADALILVWDGGSTGSAHMRSCMLDAKKPLFERVVRLRGQSANEEA